MKTCLVWEETKERLGPSSGSDLRYDLSVTLEQAFNGDQVEIALNVPAKCESCGGNGSSKGTLQKHVINVVGMEKFEHSKDFLL